VAGSHDSHVKLVVIDVVAWAVFHAGTGYLVHRLPGRRFDHDTWLTKPRRFEDDGRFYVRVLRIKRWKRHLPEAGGLFPGGFDKKHLRATDMVYLLTHARETRRAELGHWLAAACAPLFFFWNPWPVGVVMLGYGVAANGPCIAAQRYNRLRLARIVRLRTGEP
jgi:glycosyl-4,4'-diaponeurosporenoate acyltransferase